MSDAYERCAALVRTSDRDGYLAGLFAPAPARRHLYALHAFAVEIARVGAAVREPLAGEIRLQWWRDALAGERAEATGSPVAAALRDTISRCALPVGPLIGLIDAHGSELYGEPTANLAALDSHLDATTGTLFALGAAILATVAGPADGQRNPASPAGDAAAAAIATAARSAGIAYGVALRRASFAHDAGRGNIFVPAELLERHGITRDDIAARRDTAGLRAAIAQLRDHALIAYAALAAAAPALPMPTAPAFLAATLVPLLIARDGAPFATAAIPPWRRQWALWRAARRWPKIAPSPQSADTAP